MAAWQSGTHGEAAGTLACTGPSIASSALRFAGRSGTLTMTSGSPTSVIAPGSQTTQLAKGQEEEREEKITCSTLQAKSDLCHSTMTRGRLQKQQRSQGQPETEGVEPLAAVAGLFQDNRRES